jgi:hypothetical protein
MQKFIIIISFVFLSSCGTDELFKPDYFIFGKYNFSCTKDCSKFVKHENFNLYQDNVIYLSEELTFSSSALPLSQVTRVRWLENNIPTYLKNYTAQDVGCPNCAKDDALYIETRKSGVIRKWRIEPNKSKINDASTLKYIDSLDVIIQAI